MNLAIHLTILMAYVVVLQKFGNEEPKIQIFFAFCFFVGCVLSSICWSFFILSKYLRKTIIYREGIILNLSGLRNMQLHKLEIGINFVY